MFTKLIENFLTEEECDLLINLGIESNLQKMTSVKVVNGNVIEDAVLNQYTNKRMGCYFSGDELNTEPFNTINKKIIDTINSIKIYNNITYTSIPKYTFNKYDVGDFLTIHQDTHETKYGATITVVLQLNDNYD